MTLDEARAVYEQASFVVLDEASTPEQVAAAFASVEALGDEELLAALRLTNEGGADGHQPGMPETPEPPEYPDDPDAETALADAAEIILDPEVPEDAALEQADEIYALEDERATAYIDEIVRLRFGEDTEDGEVAEGEEGRKYAGASPREGLVLMEVDDVRGYKTRRWKRAADARKLVSEGKGRIIKAGAKAPAAAASSSSAPPPPRLKLSRQKIAVGEVPLKTEHTAVIAAAVEETLEEPVSVIGNEIRDLIGPDLHIQSGIDVEEARAIVEGDPDAGEPPGHGVQTLVVEDMKGAVGAYVQGELTLDPRTARTLLHVVKKGSVETMTELAAVSTLTHEMLHGATNANQVYKNTGGRLGPDAAMEEATTEILAWRYHENVMTALGVRREVEDPPMWERTGKGTRLMPADHLAYPHEISRFARIVRDIEGQTTGVKDNLPERVASWAVAMKRLGSDKTFDTLSRALLSRAGEEAPSDHVVAKVAEHLRGEMSGKPTEPPIDAVRKILQQGASR